MSKALLFRGIPCALKDQFKATAARRGDTMQDVMVALMGLYVRNPACVRVERKGKTRPTSTLPSG